jgi:hypothetical protein
MSEHDEIEDRINEFFENNFALLKMESGHSLAPEIKEAARQQVLMYWRKLRSVAERITETEVRLNLPNQETPAGRTFGIDGVVDIVREDEHVVMYDIKTHDAASIRASLAEYERQLNVYAHIWQNLRGQRLDETAIISTQLPQDLKAALRGGDEQAVEQALGHWDPLIEIPFNSSRISETVRDFGTVVDYIEQGEFTPPAPKRLRSRPAHSQHSFAADVCANCDARFSCSSYRDYARTSSDRPDTLLRQYLEDFQPAERSERILAGLEE